jgi:selenocysteine lyase/cysteine desulfurase
MANRLRAGLGLPPGDSAIVSVTGQPADAAERLQAAGVMAAGRGGALRLSCHLYTTEQDVERALAVLSGGARTIL